ncbi:MAG: hypothetical protein NVS2B16_37110 [Chloroflexota bacterium]
MKAYSPDLRSRIVAAVDAGMSKAEASRRFDVALSSVKRYVRRRAATGSLDPTPRPGRIPLIRPSQLEAVRAQLREHPAAYLDEHCALWKQSHGMQVSRITMSRAIRRAGFTRKKGRWVPLSATNRSAASGTASSPTFPLTGLSFSMSLVPT